MANKKGRKDFPALGFRFYDRLLRAFASAASVAAPASTSATAATTATTVASAAASASTAASRRLVTLASATASRGLVALAAAPGVASGIGIVVIRALFPLLSGLVVLLDMLGDDISALRVVDLCLWLPLGLASAVLLDLASAPIALGLALSLGSLLG